MFEPAYFKAINYNAVDANVDALIPNISDRGSGKRLNFEIREATPADKATIAGFNSLMAEETEGKALDPGAIKALSALPSREQLLGQLLFVMNGVPTSLVRVLNNIPQQLMNALQAIKEQKEAA